jgi:hypothetical protein
MITQLRGNFGLRVSNGMFWLVETNPSATREGDFGHAPPTGIVERALERDPSSLQLQGGRFDVLTQEVELVMLLLLGWMDRDLRGGKREDEPAGARIHRAETEHFSEEGTVGLGIAAEDHHVGPGDERLHPVSLPPVRSGDSAAERRRSGEDHEDAEADHHAEVELE